MLSKIDLQLYLIVFLHQTTTYSNKLLQPGVLYLIVFLHQTTTYSPRGKTLVGCILSFFYIKPQLVTNLKIGKRRCILSFFYIKPQPCSKRRARLLSCILSFFYIKPQLFFVPYHILWVVSYRFSTSNHNAMMSCVISRSVVSYRFSTSNHNGLMRYHIVAYVVSYRFSTSNHNQTVL